MAKIQLILVLLILTGCTAPAMLAVGGASTGVQVTTGRSPVDHAISATNNQDCQTMRIFTNEKICQDHPASNTGISAYEQALIQRQNRN